MASIPMYDPLSTEIRSPLIAGLTEACNKLSTALDLGVSEFVDLPLTPVDSNLMIYQTPLGNKLWMKSPAPKIKKNGRVITEAYDGFTINYVGGSIEFDTGSQPSELDTLTASAHYIAGQSNILEDVLEDMAKLTGIVDNFKGSYPDLETLETDIPDGDPGDFAIVSDVDGVYLYLWNERTRKWEPASKETDLSGYYNRDEIDDLLDKKQDLIPSPTLEPGTENEDYYYNGSKQWSKFSDSVKDIPLTGLDTSVEGEITEDDTLVEALGKLQNQIDKNVVGLTGTSAPTDDLEGVVGQEYTDTSNGDKYHCTEVTPEGKYIWVKYQDELEFDDEPTHGSSNPVKSSGIYNSLRKIGPKKTFVAVSNASNKAAWSDDGKTWNSTTLPDDTNWTDVIYGSGLFVATAAYKNIAAWSDDGETWNAITLPPNVNGGQLAYGGGRFVSTSVTTTALWSDDGKEWNTMTIPYGLSNITYGDGRFVAVGISSNSAAWSDDGKEWNATTFPTYSIWNDIAFGNGLFIALASNTTSVALSNDGKTWKNNDILPHKAKWKSITFGDGRFVAVASGGTSAAWSDDGKTWNATTLPSSADWHKVAYGGGRFVAVDSYKGLAAWSDDGKTWNSTTLPETPYGWTGVAYGVQQSTYSLPSGGTSGQVLTKLSDNDYDVGWVDNSGGSNATQATVTLDTTGWSSSTPSTKTVTVNGIVADKTMQNIIVSPEPTVTNIDAISSYSIFCSAQGTDSLTFTSIKGKPTIETKFNVLIENI